MLEVWKWGSNAWETYWYAVRGSVASINEVLSTLCRKYQRMEIVKRMWYTMNEGHTAWGALKSVLNNRGFGINAKKCLYERVIIPTALYGIEAWGIRSAESRKVNALEMKCLRSLVGVSRMNRLGMRRCVGELV